MEHECWRVHPGTPNCAYQEHDAMPNPKWTLGPCACRPAPITLTRPVNNAVLDIKINYCPLHAAAPEMAEALEQLVNEIKYLIEDGTLPAQAWKHFSMEQAKAALRKARGEER